MGGGIFNLATIGLIYKYETKSHLLQRKLENVGILKSQTTDFVVGRPDYYSVAGWNNMVEKLDYKCDVMFFGHSQICQSDFRKYFPNEKIINSGYPGNNVKGMLMRVPQIKALKPTKLFFMCGVNSLRMSDEEFYTKYDLLVSEIRKASPQTKLYIFNILPECNGASGKNSRNEKIRERNKFIAHYTKNKGIVMIDLYSIYADKNGNLDSQVSTDGVHLTPRGYDRWAEAIRPFMN